MSKITKEHIEGLKDEDFKEVDLHLHKLLNEAGLFSSTPIVTAHILKLVEFIKEHAEQARKDERVRVLQELRRMFLETNLMSANNIVVNKLIELTQLKETK